SAYSKTETVLVIERLGEEEAKVNLLVVAVASEEGTSIDIKRVEAESWSIKSSVAGILAIMNVTEVYSIPIKIGNSALSAKWLLLIPTS
ncbi:hypothetical protein ACKI10_46410, partial [Streptomyces galilaeus]|uniref:hypothetical protein n=1 Tax=Streptomyces galilaeus TaxID=33899 RepID=UPI0038F7CB3E